MVDFECKERYNVEDLRHIVALLRGEGGCPWDREQDHASIRRNMLEEAYELCGAIDENDPEHMREELGDVLLQVMLHSQMEEEAGRFDLNGVADGICKKLILRHPHVFGDVQVSGSAEVLTNWDDIKRREKAQKTVATAMDDVAETLPALWRTEKIQKKAAKVGFDWPEVSGAMLKLREEVEELQEGLDAGDPENIAEELGDILFCCVNLARFEGLDPEALLHAACEKFIRRFRFLEEGAAAEGKRLGDMSLDEQELIYQRARRELEGKEPHFYS